MLSDDLRKKHPQFIYEKFWFKIENSHLKIGFEFKIEPNIHFNPEILIENTNQSRLNSLDPKVINNLAFHLGLMEIPSYWKATCSPEIVIEAGSLTPEQIAWWEDLLINGLGQFFYTNQIDSRKSDFLNIITMKNKKLPKDESPLNQEKILVPVGGGKDSIVTLEILKEANKKINCLSLNPTPASTQIIDLAGCQNPIIVRREIDKTLLNLNQKGYLNGHTPFTAYIAFLSVFCGIIFDYGQIAISNERSANEGNLTWKGLKINHQYSKSFEFEKKFQEYAQKYLTSDIHYFSFLQPLHEIQIAKLLTQYPNYFSIFRSCNKNQKTNSWCNECPKCLSSFIILAPFLEEKDLKKIFGQNLFEKESLLPILKELLGEEGFKPFECVATIKEILVAIYLTLKNYQGHLPLLLQFFKEKILPKYPSLETNSVELLQSWNQENNLPKQLAKILKSKIQL